MIVILMSVALGAITYVIGVLPLSFAFSKQHVAQLSVLGSGLLLGAALGIIIPEGVETLIEAHPGEETPVTKMAFALLAGFAFMLLVEQAGSGGHGHDADTYTLQTRPNAPSVDHVEFEANLDDLERNTEQQARQRTNAKSDQEPEESANGKRAFALTLGLCLHALTDGLALGVSAISDTVAADRESNLSFVVFIALIIHKAPTTLAFATSLLTLSLSPEVCKRYIAIFSASTPVGAVISYGLFSFMDLRPEWTGVAILVSGGSFLYVATVLQPVSHQTDIPASEHRLRPILIAIGMFIPVTVAYFIGHGH